MSGNNVGRPKGLPKTGGRQKGTPNKIRAEIREDILDAFEKLGGIEYLVRVGQTDPKTFLNLYAKLVPTKTEISGDEGAPLTFNIVTGVPRDDD